MADNDTNGGDNHRGYAHSGSSKRTRRRPDTATLSAGLLTLAIATYLLGDFAASGMQWVLAVAAVCVGAVMLAASLSPDSKRNSAKQH